MSTDPLTVAAALQAAGTPFVLATVVASYPPQSVRAGAKAIIRADGTLDGWVGGGCVRPVVLQEAMAALADGRPRLVRLNAGAEPGAEHPGVRSYPMTCQGEGGVEIYLEPLVPVPRLVVLGGTPAARALARLGAELGYAVIVAGPGLTADAVHAWAPEARVAPDAAAATAGLGETAAVVVATMGAGDEDALAAAALSGAAYVGLVASRKKGAFLLDYLAAHGVPAERLARVKAPAGLDLGGMQPAEIALSVLAEIVQRRYAGRGTTQGTAQGTAQGMAQGEGGGERLAHRVDPPRPAETAASPSSSPSSSRPRRPLALAQLPVDPVCGMPVDPATAAHTLVVGGEPVYFCCPHCKAEYERRHR